MTAAARLVVLGTGTVGQAVVQRHAQLRQRGLDLPPLALLANSRGVQMCGRDAEAALWQSRVVPRRTQHPAAHLQVEKTLQAGDVLIDATASEAVAGCHPRWLESGIHVVTANKLGAGGPLLRQQRIERAQASGLACYGDAATVGAGLPLLRTLRALQAGGDRILGIEGVLSGSLAWLLSGDDGSIRFSARVRQARAAGYTEPDPRIDLSGEDVRRKLLILVRSVGIAMESQAIAVQSLLPPALAEAADAQLDAALDLLDAPMADARSCAQGRTLAFVARWDVSGGATVGLSALADDHPLAAGQGTDNRLLIRSERYDQQPLCIQGPGAGAAVTAAALLDDTLRICRRAGREPAQRFAG